VNPAQPQGACWLEPLDALIGKPDAAFRTSLPVDSSSNVDGRVAAIPAFDNAMFIDYCTDLLEKHGRAAQTLG